MNQYYVFEIQQYANGEYGHIVHFSYDANATMARLKAESKYHEVLAAAAISQLLSHSATLLTADGRVIMNQCYHHPIETPSEEGEGEGESEGGEGGEGEGEEPQE